MFFLCLAHVPAYDDSCVENCCTPPQHHTTSQVIYLRGPGGLEVHIADSTKPFNIAGGEVIDVDAIFRDEIDQSTYDLYIGCGGCVASQDALVNQSLVNLTGYQLAEVEPFTQTKYYSVFAKEDRKFDTRNLVNCTEHHFTIRLVDHIPDRSSPIVWAPVIGLEERFTFLELLEFPIYILRNHGPTWNDLGYTYWLWLFVGAPLLINTVRELIRCTGARVLDPYPCARAGPVHPRELLYELAIIGFVAAGLEELTHLVYVQVGAPVAYGLYVGLFAVILLAQGIGIFFVLVVWRGLRHRKDRWCTEHSLWAPLEVATGFSVLFLFGAGFYVGPAAIVAAGLIRFGELCHRRPAKHQPKDVRAVTSHRQCRGSGLGFLGHGMS